MNSTGDSTELGFVVIISLVVSSDEEIKIGRRVDRLTVSPTNNSKVNVQTRIV